jgi:hypothetical protein
LGKNFRSDDAFWNLYNEARPRLLGCVLDGAAGALRMRRELGGDNNEIAKELLGDGDWPRFVDVVVWAEMACRVMGFPPGVYIEAFRRNQDYAIRWVADHNPICVGIRDMILARGSWEGYPEQLYRAIQPYAKRIADQLDGKFPASSATMIKFDLNRAIAPLEKVYGIIVRPDQRLRQNDNKNGIKIWQVGRGRQFPRSEAVPERVETVDLLLGATLETENLPTPTYPEQDKPEPPKPPTQPVIRRR